MIKLAPFGTDLTEYTVQLLARHDITKVRDFLDADISKINKIINLPEVVIAEIKQKLRKIHGPAQILLSEQVTREKRRGWRVYKTGIETLDSLLEDDGFNAGTIWEICGLAGIGKTQFCHTLALNFVSRYDAQVLYIDTKCDFSGSRIRQMLQHRKLEKTDAARLMHHIKVERTLNAVQVVTILEELMVAIEAKNETVRRIKFVIIDSLPAVWFLLRGDENSLEGKILLSKLSFVLHKLASRHFIAALVVNLSMPLEDHLVDNELQNVLEETTDGNEVEPPTQINLMKTVELRPALGRYWASVPRVRLSMEWPQINCENDGSLRVLRVLKSCYTCTSNSCYVRITNAGVG